MKVGIFSEVKTRLNIGEVFRFYGVRLDKASFTVCPFHRDKTPSLKVYLDKGSFHCFGCNAHGDVIDFAGRLFGLKPIDAARKLDEDFGLGLMDKTFTTEQRREATERIKQREADDIEWTAFVSWEREYFNFLSDLIAIGTVLLEKLEPQTIADPFTDEYAETFKLIQYLRYLQEIPCDAELCDRVALYRQYLKYKTEEAAA